jgi:hypothetical protein
MKKSDKATLQPGTTLPVHDYQRALQSAVSWLGERYLLAEPVRKRREPAQPYFTETRRWYPVTRH